VIWFEGGGFGGCWKEELLMVILDPRLRESLPENAGEEYHAVPKSITMAQPDSHFKHFNDNEECRLSCKSDYVVFELQLRHIKVALWLTCRLTIF